MEFYIANTDAQSLLVSSVPKDSQIQIGKKITDCLGAGANPEVGKQAAEEDLSSVIEKIGNTNMCFITAGMGGGTGTGAGPVLAKALRDKGILTIGMVCMPFKFEGKRKMKIAMEGMKEMQNAVDTLIVVQNERLMKTLMNNSKANKGIRTSLGDSFKMVDNIFFEGIKAVTDVIIKPGLINLDFADVRTITEGPGWGIMGSGYAEGHGKAETATIAALNNPLLSDTSKKNATGVLVSITGGPDLAILEVDEVLRLIREEVSEDANVIFGATSEEDMKGAIRVSLILTGPYEDSQLHPVEEPLLKESPSSSSVNTTSNNTSTTTNNTATSKFAHQIPTSDNAHASPRASQVFQVETEQDDIDDENVRKEQEEKQRRTIPKAKKQEKQDSWWSPSKWY